MPVLWQSSQRPMYIRTVWIDGFRHAILTHDDPCLQKKKRRPYSSASRVKTASSRLSRRTNVSDSDSKFNYVITSYNSNSRSQTYEIESLNLTDLEETDEETPTKTSPKPQNAESGGQNDLNFIMKPIRVTKTARIDVKENTELSDRVLQWLDLAGKVDLLAPENAEKLAQPRHSCPELERRNFSLAKSKTTVDIRKTSSPKAIESSKGQQNNIDRHEFNIPPANTIENYARQSRNVRTASRNEIGAKRTEKNKRETKPNVVETRQKIVKERDAVEKQYAELISKKLIPNVSKNSKRQMHIFMPELPKKPLSDVTSRAESLLSQISMKSLK